MKDAVIILIVAAFLYAAIRYIIKSKKNGGKCIGCPMSKECKKNKCD